MKTNEINLRDPFILPIDDKYYMYGSRVEEQCGFDVYVGEDLENWSEGKEIFATEKGFWGVKDFWAPEVHIYEGKYYLFASFKADDLCRGTAILVSDTPDGHFKVHNARVTPEDWECLDGTLWVENGTPYMIFCHEWIQVHNGEMCAVELTKDLKATVGEPFLLWRAGDAPWISSVTEGMDYVTDGPFLYSVNGELKSMWSSFSKGRYVLATATAKNGSIKGKWVIDDNLLFDKDGGHGMVFTAKNGTKMISIHSPNIAKEERPKFLKF